MVTVRSNALIALSATAVLAAGCADQSADHSRSIVEGGALGAIACGGLAAILGGDAATIAAAAVACGAAGAVFGDYIGRTKEDYASQEDMIEEERKLIAQRVQETEEYRNQLLEETQALQQEAASLQADRARGIDTRNRARRLRQSAEDKLEEAEDQLTLVRAELRTTWSSSPRPPAAAPPRRSCRTGTGRLPHSRCRNRG